MTVHCDSRSMPYTRDQNDSFRFFVQVLQGRKAQTHLQRRTHTHTSILHIQIFYISQAQRPFQLTTFIVNILYCTLSHGNIAFPQQIKNTLHNFQQT